VGQLVQISHEINFIFVLQVAKNNVERTCKCHGVSGSCSVKTCWNQLAPHHVTGNMLKKKYDSAVEVVMDTNQAISESHLTRKRLRSRGRRTRPGKKDIVYIDVSPSYCRKGEYSSGTRARTCQPDEDCDILCCGRGYNTRQMYEDKPCYCKVIWCCDVRCQTCTELKDIYTCK
jgi:wingless-type MMTV integration site family protein 9